jgi:hypothetical protein
MRQLSIILGVLAIFGVGASSQDNPPAKEKAAVSQTISASFNNTGQHPGSAAVKGPVQITCTAANSNHPNGSPRPSCQVSAPGFGGPLERGKSAGTSGAGTVILTCNGQGRLTCSLRIDG